MKDRLLVGILTLFLAIGTSAFIVWAPFTSAVINLGFGVALSLSILKWMR